MKETFIHPTALVEPGVELGQGVSVGPFCHIQSGAVIGDNSVLMSHVVVTDATTLGRAPRFIHMQCWAAIRRTISIRVALLRSM